MCILYISNVAGWFTFIAGSITYIGVHLQHIRDINMDPKSVLQSLRIKNKVMPVQIHQ